MDDQADAAQQPRNAAEILARALGTAPAQVPVEDPRPEQPTENGVEQQSCERDQQ